MKNLIYTIALLVSFVSFGQNFPFEISKDFVKLNEEEKYDFLLQEYKGFKEKDFSFAKEFHNIKGNYEIYRRKDVDLIYENILIYTLNSNETIENIYEDFNRYGARPARPRVVPRARKGDSTTLHSPRGE